MFSVVIPIYNHAAFVRQAVWSALRSPLVTEVLLLDDGSRDASPEIAAKLAAADSRVRNLTQAGDGNRGAHHRLNELVHAARCEWVAVLNSDDLFVDGRFESISSHPNFPVVDFVFGNLLLMSEEGELVGAKRGPFDTGTPFPALFDVKSMVSSGGLLDLLSHQQYLGTTSNMVFRKALHARVGGFSPHRYVHDWDFALRAMALGRVLYIQRYITTYRFHARNTIHESAERVNQEARDVFDRFVADFPELAARPGFRVGFEHNVNVATLLPSKW